MKNQRENSEPKLFCRIFSFMTAHFHLTAKMLCERADGEFSESSVSSWRTRNAPGSNELFRALASAFRACLEDREMEGFCDRGNYIREVSKVISEFAPPPAFLYDEEKSLSDLVFSTLSFAYYSKDSAPAKAPQSAVPLRPVVRPPAKTEAIVFDFDGTLTAANKVRTTWESIWVNLGYDVNECVKLYKMFNDGEITHDQWCALTAEKFIAKKLHRDQLDPLIADIRLIDGLEEVLLELDRRDIKVYIVSGSIKYIIRKSLGGLAQYISGGIDANVFDFDENGYLTQIIGTKFDFEGKATRISEIARDLNTQPDRILFVGNSLNDEWVHSSGARTLAINPIHTNMFDRDIWDDSIVYCNSLKEVLAYL